MKILSSAFTFLILVSAASSALAGDECTYTYRKGLLDHSDAPASLALEEKLQSRLEKKGYSHDPVSSRVLNWKTVSCLDVNLPATLYYRSICRVQVEMLDSSNQVVSDAAVKGVQFDCRRTPRGNLIDISPGKCKVRSERHMMKIIDGAKKLKKCPTES